MALDKLMNQVIDMLTKYKVIAIVGVFLSFFIAVTLLNFVQKATLEGFVTLQHQNKHLEHFTGKKKNSKLKQ